MHIPRTETETAILLPAVIDDECARDHVLLPDLMFPAGQIIKPDAVPILLVQLEGHFHSICIQHHRISAALWTAQVSAFILHALFHTDAAPAIRIAMHHADRAFLLQGERAAFAAAAVALIQDVIAHRLFHPHAHALFAIAIQPCLPAVIGTQADLSAEAFALDDDGRLKGVIRTDRASFAILHPHIQAQGAASWQDIDDLDFLHFPAKRDHRFFLPRSIHHIIDLIFIQLLDPVFAIRQFIDIDTPLVGRIQRHCPPQPVSADADQEIFAALRLHQHAPFILHQLFDADRSCPRIIEVQDAHLMHARIIDDHSGAARPFALIHAVQHVFSFAFPDVIAPFGQLVQRDAIIVLLIEHEGLLKGEGMHPDRIAWAIGLDQTALIIFHIFADLQLAVVALFIDDDDLCARTAVQFDETADEHGPIRKLIARGIPVFLAFADPITARAQICQLHAEMIFRIQQERMRHSAAAHADAESLSFIRFAQTAALRADHLAHPQRTGRIALDRRIKDIGADGQILHLDGPFIRFSVSEDDAVISLDLHGAERIDALSKII